MKKRLVILATVVTAIAAIGLVKSTQNKRVFAAQNVSKQHRPHRVQAHNLPPTVSSRFRLDSVGGCLSVRL
jgi:hypothetical protein